MSESTPFYDLGPGKVIGDRYEVVRANRQGSTGGMSVAFEVVDLQTRERLEVQYFAAALFEDEEQAREFAASWEPWKRIDSPAIVGVRDVVMADPAGMILVTDFPRGERLRSILGRTPRFEPPAVVRLGEQLLEGLGEVHANGVVHGDVKPNAIYLEEESAQACLVDGGVTPGLWTAKHLGDKTALIGTPYYAPAEQFGGEGPNVQSDLYNVATVLFEVLTGVLPWRGKSFLEVFQAKLEKEPPSIRSLCPDLEVDPALERAIAGGLKAEPQHRYATAQEFLSALGSVDVG